MKHGTRILFFLLSLLLLVQIPFVYRRQQIGILADRIQEMDTHRSAEPETETDFAEYKGIIHVHSSIGGHSSGNFDELIKAANANDLDFVLMTEHYRETHDTAALTLKGFHGRTLFVGGNEIDTRDGDRFLMIPGSKDAASFKRVSTAEFIATAKAENRIALVTYPEKFKSWDTDFDGVEVFSMNTEAKKMNPFVAALDLVWSFQLYPELTIVNGFRRPDENLRQFDIAAANRKTTLFLGTDAHSNIGLHLLGDDTGHKLMKVKIDPYETIFRIARTHVLIEKGRPINTENLISAIRRGRLFTGFDVIGDTTGFSFSSFSRSQKNVMGDEVEFEHAPSLLVVSPSKARIVVLKDGEKFHEEFGRETTAKPDAPGVYRVEIYLDQLGSPFDNLPWIISNPIYVR